MTAAPLTLAYVVNQYPKLSHTFIRREIAALEQQGVTVHRFAMRGWLDQQVAAQDRREQLLTHYALAGGPLALLLSGLLRLGRQPLRFMKALRLALSLGWRADRPWPVHLIYLLEACRILQELERRGCQVDMVHAHFGTNAAEVALLISHLSGLRFSFTVHGPEEFDRPLTLKLGRKIQDAAAVMAISSFGRSQLFRWVGQSEWHKIHVVPCGLESSYFSDVPEARTRDALTSRRLVCVGRLSEQKGQALLLQSAALLLADGVRDFEILLVGDGPMRQDLEALSATLGLQSHVIFMGDCPPEQVREVLIDARAMVLASFAEGLPVVLMEAMAIGRPVVATAIAGIPELVIPGENGWLVPAGNARALADAMGAVLASDAATLERLGRHGREAVGRTYRVERSAGLLRDLWQASRTAS